MPRVRPIDEIKERADACLRAVRIATDPSLKQMFKDLHRRWLSVAEASAGQGENATNR
jgi:hypothetical protein